jgi:hypothetical protein
MRNSVSLLLDKAVSEEIRRIVAEAIRNRTSLSASAAAAEILDLHPRCGLNERQLADQVMMAAASANVPVEVGRSAPAQSADIVALHKVVIGTTDIAKRPLGSDSA